ncbi:aromatic amino acid DMT transporter YddG [Roseateles sp. NT4]|uniref:aromatic amino acid DMT transporter YddG n=1 Tax=Roseateles sp. NT4 TaxID=3453715 RepID=UPI003EEFB600
MAVSSRAALAMGLGAILLWSTSVGTMRGITEHLGATGGAAVLYTLSALLLFAVTKRTPLKAFPPLYLLLGTALFVGYQLCFALAVGLARSRSEAIEVGMVNYLWPSLTVVCSALALRQRVGVVMLTGLALAFAGVVVACMPAHGFSLSGFVAHATGNPLSYGLALGAAVTWALYCTVTNRLAKGCNGVWLFMALSAVAFWALHLLRPGTPSMHWSLPAVGQVLLAGSAVGAAYALWNLAILRGNVGTLGLAANATPLLSALFASLWLSTALPLSFWAGAGLVVVGSALAGRGR